MTRISRDELKLVVNLIITHIYSVGVFVSTDDLVTFMLLILALINFIYVTVLSFRVRYSE